MHRIAGLVALLVMLGWSQTVYAQLIRYDFAGTVTNLSGGAPCNSGVVVGDQLVGVFNYVAFGNPDRIPASDLGIYTGSSFSVSVPGQTVTSTDPNVTSISTLNGSPDIVSFGGSSNSLTFNGDDVEMAVTLVDATGAVLTSDALPGATLQLSDFTSAIVRLGWSTFAFGCNVRASLTSLEAITPEEMLSNLIADVIDLNLQTGIANSFDAKLDTVLDALDDLNENNDVAASNVLYAFINAVEAQRGKKLTDSDADILVSSALAIITAIEG